MFEISINPDNDFSQKLELKKLAKFVLKNEFKFGEFSCVDVSINFVDKSEIHRLNREYRDIDRPTDVLSFECDGLDSEKSDDAHNTQTHQDIFDLGDIFICLEVASDNAEKYNSSIDNEVKLLVVHGLLHLCGYDHIIELDAKIMEALEDELLDKWNNKANVDKKNNDNINIDVEKFSDDDLVSTFKSGFVSLIGRPNSGKSTLINTLVGQKVAITSSMAQTTRHQLRGIYNDGSTQVIFVDTPGIHKPHDVLGQELNASAIQGFSDVDIVVMMIDASQPVGTGDEWVANQIKNLSCKKFCCLSKIDLVDDAQINEQIIALRRLGDWDDVVSVSSKDKINLDDFLSLIKDNLPAGPAWFDTDTVTDQDENVIIAEIIREKIIQKVHDEVPHSIGVIVEDIEYIKKKNMYKIYSTIFVERDSQRGIIIGKSGNNIKIIGSNSRAELEKMLDAKVFLDLSVKIRKNWRRDLNQIRRFGYGEGL